MGVFFPYLNEMPQKDILVSRISPIACITEKKLSTFGKKIASKKKKGGGRIKKRIIMSTYSLVREGNNQQIMVALSIIYHIIWVGGDVIKNFIYSFLLYIC